MFMRHAPFLATILLTSTLVALADEPALTVTTRPASGDVEVAQPEPQQDHPKWQSRKPATQPVAEAQLQKWFNELGASDAAVRERATTAMLELTRAELPALRRVVERSRPVSPAQAGALRDLVAHVYLSAEIYDCEPRVGFLGLTWPALDSVDVPRAADEVQQPPPRIEHGIDGLPRASTGVPVDFRIPGFCAYRALRDGDVVLGIVQPVDRRLHDWTQLTYTIKAFPAGQKLTLEVLRQGTVLKVPVTLDAKPLVANDQVWSAVVLPTREAAAEAYWAEHFAPLVGEDRLSSAGTASDQATSAQASTARD